MADFLHDRRDFDQLLMLVANEHGLGFEVGAIGTLFMPEGWYVFGTFKKVV